MSDDGMFCPYKKSTKREVSYSWISRTEITTERFGWCSEKKCMPMRMAAASGWKEREPSEEKKLPDDRRGEECA
jgi:hypothetical protein